MRIHAALVTLALATVLCGCGEAVSLRESPPSPAAEPGPAPTALTCPTGEMVTSDGGLFAAGHLPDGYATPERAVEVWLGDVQRFGDDYVLTRDGRGAWVLRPDGTAKARVSFLRHSGYSVHGYQACSPTR
jgi:hypothetical protein